MEAPEYFDNVTIGQFALTGIPTKVYVDGRYLSITDPDDVEDDDIGFGMDSDGEMHNFDYRLVVHINVGGQIVDLETFKKAMEDDNEPEGGDSDKKSDDKKDAADKDKKTDGDKKQEKNPFEGVIQLKNLISELSKEELDAQVDALEAEMEAGKAKIDAAKKKLANLKKQPIEESSQKFMPGDIIHNTNKDCAQYGSIGVVQRVMMDDDDEYVIYRVTNNGHMFKTGDLFTKTANQLKPYTKDDLMPQPDLPSPKK